MLPLPSSYFSLLPSLLAGLQHLPTVVGSHRTAAGKTAYYVLVRNKAQPDGLKKDGKAVLTPLLWGWVMKQDGPVNIQNWMTNSSPVPSF